MITFASISSFRSKLDALLNVKRGVYAGVANEICNAFKEIPIEQIRANRDMILADEQSMIIKLRLPDKMKHLSKADGFRLIYLVMKQIELVAFLDIYPKRGPLQQLTIDSNQLVGLLNEFTTESQTQALVLHDINQGLIP